MLLSPAKVRLRIYIHTKALEKLKSAFETGVCSVSLEA